MFTTSTSCRNCVDCNKQVELFKNLKDEEFEILNKGRFEVTFKAGETIFKQGAVSEHFISITSGYAKVYLEGIASKNQILKIAKPWELIGGPGLHLDSRLYFSVKAISEVSACFIKINSFREILLLNGQFVLDFLTYLSRIHVNLFDQMISLTHKQMPGRIADGLLYLSNSVFGDRIDTHYITRQDLADLTSMSKDSAIRILKEFEKDGHIDCSGDSIEIINLEALHKISKNG